MQETVNGITFDTDSLFFELVGVGTDGKPFEDECWVHPQPASHADAEAHARGMLDRASLVTCVRVLSHLTNDMAIRVSTVWR